MKVTVVVRFADPGAGSAQVPDLNLPLSINPERDDVNKLVNTSWLKMMIRTKMPATSRRRLRLIYNGRILNDQINFRSDVFGPAMRQLSAAGESPDTLKVYIHCLMGEELTPDQLSHEKELDRRAQAGTDPPVVGFDRLLSQGVSVQDVNDLRRQFHQIYLPGFAENGSGGVADVEEDESRQEYIRQLEERWLESTNGNGNTDTQPAPQQAERPTPDLEPSSHNEDLLLGLLVGTFLGVVALVFLLMDDTMFNNTQKMAMVLGISINVFIALMRVGSMYSA